MNHPLPIPSDHQKIHPVDIKARPPSSPLFPSDKANPNSVPNHNNDNNQHPPFRHTIIPVTCDVLPPPGKSKSRTSCCRFIFWTLVLLLLLLVLTPAAAGILYLILSPKLPRYSVDRLHITNFTIDPFTLTAHAALALTVTASNANTHISIYYEEASFLSITYSNSTSSLCTGTFPVFYQGCKNVTVVDVVMSGETRLERETMGRLGAEERNGMVPLRFRGEVPVRIKVAWLKLWKVTSKVRCDLVVSSLNTGDRISSIKTNRCKFGFKL